AAPVKKTRNFLLESGSASSESEPEDEDPESSPAAPLAAAQKLPSPPLNASSDTSVFANPFKAQADQKLSALQKHVPLTMQAKPSQIGGKRICLSYRKDGRCRFGIKCKFAHDSDLQTPAILTDFHPPVSEETPEAEGSSSGGRSQSTPREIKEEEAEGQQVKKKRVGLSDSLIPPKRAMKQFTILSHCSDYWLIQ
uniref:Si:ch211-113e8.11 n=1 Tax=Amphilophus citrinellus TaxID=61819 RepID=A0A3Q0RWV5_AMPCI